MIHGLYQTDRVSLSHRLYRPFLPFLGARMTTIEFQHGTVSLCGKGNAWTASTTVKIGDRSTNERAFTVQASGASQGLALCSLRDHLHIVWEVARLLSPLDYPETNEIYQLADEISAHNQKELNL